MGLSAPKRRTKLANDPNNTAWSKSTTGFGHKIMSKQGWKPGEYLGAQNASQAEHYTAANASHIRVLLREDNLGLGAQLGGGGKGGNAETFGLSLIASVLGRLNGKSEAEVEKQTTAIRDAEVRNYQARKYGVMNFVRGGLLVGDEMRPPETLGGPGGVGEVALKKKRKLDDAEEQAEDVRESKKSKKRDHVLEGETDEQAEEGTVVLKKKSKRQKGDKKAQANEVEGSYDTADSDMAAKKKKKRSKSTRDLPSDDHRPSKSKDTTSSTSKEDKARLTAEKAARKQERRKRKEERRQGKAHDAQPAQSPPEVDSSDGEAPQAEKAPTEGAFGGSRHAVRQRYIQQKRMASMNAQAMKEIFMLQASA